MKISAIGSLTLLLAFGMATGCAKTADVTSNSSIGQVDISTIPLDKNIDLISATYTPSGKVLVTHSTDMADPRHVDLAVMDDDGKNLHTFFSGSIPPREKGNGIRMMVFPDNKRILMGDFVLECAPDIDRCEQPALLPVEYPPQFKNGDNMLFRWSEIIIAPDNEHVAWTTLLSNYAAMAFTGKLEREIANGKPGYKIVDARIISTLEPFRPDPNHADGVIPNPVRNGEVKQFVEGGSAISLVGGANRDTADSVVLDLITGDVTAITQNPGYNETTIFSPDEKFGIVMSTRFSPSTDMAILGLMPRPYPTSLNMGLNMHVYTYSVTGVRRAREGNIGPVLIDIEASKADEGYQGVNLNTESEWVFYSPMSWHPGSKKALWVEGIRNQGSREETDVRIQVAHLRDYASAKPVAAKPTPDEIPFASSDLSEVDRMVQRSKDADVTVYGKHSGQVKYRHHGMTIEKTYVNFSDDGKSTYNGNEQMQLNPRGNSTYTADIKLTGPKPGVMNLKMTFGPIHAKLPSQLIFAPDQNGVPLTHGYAEYDGKRLTVDTLAP